MSSAVCHVRGPEGLFPGTVIVERDGSNNVLLICQRSQVSAARKHVELGAYLQRYSGVYLLLGTSQRVYVGQSTNFLTRLRQHDNGQIKAFADWSNIAIFLGPQLSAYVDYLERELISLAQKALPEEAVLYNTKTYRDERTQPLALTTTARLFAEEHLNDLKNRLLLMGITVCHPAERSKNSLVYTLKHRRLRAQLDFLVPATAIILKCCKR
jgi:hypothetical protein